MNRHYTDYDGNTIGVVENSSSDLYQTVAAIKIVSMAELGLPADKPKRRKKRKHNKRGKQQ